MLTFSEENHIKSIFHLSASSQDGVSTNSIAENLNTKASSVTEMLKKLSDKNLIIYKKGLYNANDSEESELLKILNPLINSKSVWQSHALYLVAEFFYLPCSICQDGQKQK